MPDDTEQWCVLNLRKFPCDLRKRLHIRAAHEENEIYDIVARYVRAGLDREDAEEQSKGKQKKK